MFEYRKELLLSIVLEVLFILLIYDVLFVNVKFKRF